MSDMNPGRNLSAAAEAVRSFNHTSRSTGDDWKYPSHAYFALGSLSRLVQMLGQAVGQSTLPVIQTFENGRVLIDGNGDAPAAVAELVMAQADALKAAEELTAAVMRMHNATSPMGLDTRGLPEFEDDEDDEPLPMHDSHNPEYGFGR